ncbi:hypothetical protein HNR46_000233 [Haloferula luteola]|uniref:Uncharacterized protein n=1 Tax=Haloferula luteola TaxID=595692 RepID=A0A840UW51_9BACT|nr:hypothetical protein [Haloferula luteola]MBB5350012.1 hypothetical protein [Haloferula luteola]
MPQSSPEPSSTRQVERIREILVGRQLNQVEHRLARLEATLRPMPLEAEPSSALAQEVTATLAQLKDEFDAERLRQMEETRRLAHQIQTVARQRREISDEARQAVVDELRPGFERWQEGFMHYLEIRENRLRHEVARSLQSLRDESPQWSPEIRDALGRLAGAACDLCEALQPPDPS